MGSERVFAAWIPGIVDGTPPDGYGLYRTTSAAKARYLCYLSARDAEFEVALTDVKVRRAAEFDAATFRNGSMPSYARLPSSPEGGHGG